MFPFHPHGAPKPACTLLAVIGSASVAEHKASQNQHKYPFPELVSAGRLEVCTIDAFACCNVGFGFALGAMRIA